MPLAYRLMDIHADPSFAMLSTLVAFLLCVHTGALIRLGMMYEPEESPEIIALLAAFVGFGLAASRLRFTAPPALRFVLRWIT